METSNKKHRQAPIVSSNRMTITTYILTIGLSLTLLTCGQTRVKSDTHNDSRELVPNLEENKKDTIKDRHLAQIIFGFYCGQCSHNCATMYHFNMMGNQNSLSVDYTDSYFKDSGKIIFATQITDIKKSILASEIVRHIPDYLLTTDKSSERFGCPDCTDGCGIYFETIRDTTVKKFYVDTDLSQLTGDIKTFSEYLQTTIHKIEK
jgi:hypothetical protein